MEKRVSVITLGVTDLARSRRFYESGLGWSLDSGGDDIAFYQAGGFIVGSTSGPSWRRTLVWPRKAPASTA
jgi:uncharacterized protein